MGNKLATEILGVHIYNLGALSGLPSAIKTAERLGYRVEIRVTRDAQDNIHSLIATASPPPDENRN